MSGRPLLALFLLTLSACTYRGLSPSAPPSVTTDDAPPLSYYDAGGQVPEPVLHEVEVQTPDWVRERVDLPARVPPELADIPRVGDPIELLHYRPRLDDGRKRPLILMSPILENGTALVDFIAEGYARMGWHAVIVKRKELGIDPKDTLTLAESEPRLLVMRSRQALDWLLTRPDVDPDRLGTLGISAGAIVSSMLAGADRRLRAHVWLLAGGPLADVMSDSSEQGIRETMQKGREATGLSKSAMREGLRSALRTDPITMAPRVGRDRVLLMLARYDTAVPYRYGLTLWKALGRPELVVLPAQHVSALVFLPYADQLARSFFRRKFSGAAFDTARNDALE